MWLFVRAMTALVGCSVVLVGLKMALVEPGDWPISTMEMSLSAHWELSQSVIDTLGSVRVI